MLRRRATSGRLKRAKPESERVTDPRPTLVAYGAPLGARPRAEMTLEKALVRSLGLLGEAPRVFLSLPLVLAASRERLDFERLRRVARAARRGPELGLVLELTSEVTGDPFFGEQAVGLSARSGAPQFLVPVDTAFVRRTAELEAPEVARRWGFRFRTPVSSFREFYGKHHG